MFCDEPIKKVYIGDIEDEEENNTSVSIPANSLTVIIAEGSIEIK